jgi:spore germination protein GerM
VSDSISVQEAITRKVHLYFADRKGNYLQAEERKILAEDTISAIEAIIAALLEGPDDPKLVSTIPAGSHLLHIFVTDDGTAYLDFSSELSRLHPGGITAERLTLYTIVNSLVLNLEQVERVQLLFEGKPASTLSGHLDIRQAKTANLLLVR